MKAVNKILSKDNLPINQILPHRNKWAWDFFLKGCANNWMPTEISMAKDIEQWKSKDTLSDDEKLVIKRCLGFFAGSESLVSNNLLLSIYYHINDAECRQYLLRQANEEALHNLTIVYICDSLNLDIKEVYEAYSNIPSIKAKDEFLIKAITNLDKNKFSSIDFIRNLIIYYIICEGIFFYSGFALLLSFGRQQKMPGISEQIQYTLRDESLHIEFGTKLILKLLKEEEISISDEKIGLLNLIDTAIELENKYASEVLPNGILGLNSEMFITYIKYIANRRLVDLGLKPKFNGVNNPFPWLSEIIDLEKCKNFFESRVTEYRVGSIKDDF